MSNEEKEATAPGIGPAWQVVEIAGNGKVGRLVLETGDLTLTQERTLRQWGQRRLPVDVTAYPATPSPYTLAAAHAAGMQRARDLLAAHADESEALARGQAAEAEQAQTRATASANRAAVQRAQVATLDREIAALKGEGK